MEHKPALATGYSAAGVQLARRASLYLATKLGDLRDDVVIVGGLVPSLIVPPERLPPGKSPHVGTMDVDLGLAVALLDQRRYHELGSRLRNAGFRPGVNDEDKPTSQRWRIASDSQDVTVDFLIPASKKNDRGGKLRNFEDGFAAIITPGLELAFDDRRLLALGGETLRREKAERELWVCEAGAFVVLKALAFRGRGENKDAYDLLYVIQNYGSGIGDVFRRLRPLLSNPFAMQALAILENDFSGMDRVGTRRMAEFLGDSQEETIRADAAGAVRSLLALCR